MLCSLCSPCADALHLHSSVRCRSTAVAYCFPVACVQCGSLPIALAARGHRVMVVSPQYSDFGAEPSEVRVLHANSGQPCILNILWSSGNAIVKQHGCSAVLQVKIPVSGTEAGLSHLQRKGVDFVFVSHPSYMRQGLYSDTSGVYGDNQVRQVHLWQLSLYLGVQRLG